MVDFKKLLKNQKVQPIDYRIQERFLSSSECEGLIELSKSRLQPSSTVNVDTGKVEQHKDRVSETCFFRSGENSLIDVIENRIAEMTGIPNRRGEPLQVQHYGVGGFYRAHHDYFDPAIKGHEGTLKVGGQRVATVILYLNTVARGGETEFPSINVRVHPLQGNALFWWNINRQTRQIEPLTLHQANPVLEGEKWIATKWLREGDYQ